MDAFYGSGEEIAFGPRTFREIKADLKRPMLRKPNTRHTLHCVKSTEIDKMSNALPEDTILEVSAYLTASEAASVKNDTQFYSTEENSAFEYDFQNKNMESSLNNDVTQLNFVKNVMARQSDSVIENEHITFAQSPQNNSSFVHTDGLDFIELSNDNEEPLSEKANLSCVLEISDDSIPNTSDYSEKDCSKQEEFCEIESYCKYSDDSPLDQSVINVSKYPTISAITIPEIDLQQFNDSSICPLNNTLDRIDAILNQAEEMSLTESSIENDFKNTNEYNMSDRQAELNLEDLKISPLSKQSIASNILRNEDYTHCNVISGSFLQKPLSDLPTKTTPTKYQTPFKSNSTVKSNIPVLKRSPNTFKVPTLPTPKSKPNLKDIISPVRMYIKYSPRPVLKRNPESTKFQKPLSIKNKENIDFIPPNIVYKPSKSPVFGSERNICLPPSLDKMVSNSTVTRHERNPVSMNLFRKNISLVQECDLTKYSFSESQLNDDQNMSVLHKTPAFKE